jgi:photosystem II stability/assembly factor-like uncharacterized protein
LWYSGDTLYRSVDADGDGHVSLPLYTNSINDVAVHPNHPSLIYVATEEGLLRSEDGGQTWGDTGAPFRATALVMTAEETLYVGTEGGGLYSYSPE